MSHGKCRNFQKWTVLPRDTMCPAGICVTPWDTGKFTTGTTVHIWMLFCISFLCFLFGIEINKRNETKRNLLLNCICPCQYCRSGVGSWWKWFLLHPQWSAAAGGTRYPVGGRAPHWLEDWPLASDWLACPGMLHCEGGGRWTCQWEGSLAYWLDGLTLLHLQTKRRNIECD